jgi:ribose transport system permease protein
MKKNGFRKVFSGELTGISVVLILIFIILVIWAEGFTTFYNMNNLIKTIAVIILVGLSQLSVLSIGHLNLALGAMGLLTGMFTGFLLESYSLPMILIVFISLLVGALIGLIQGLFIVKTKINPFIVTLAFVSIYSGLVIGITKGEVFTKQPAAFVAIDRTNIFGLPMFMIISLIIAAVLIVIFMKTAFGRQILATGENLKAAAYAGINTIFTVIAAHTLSGLLAGAAGILQISRLGAATPTIGADWLLISFAAPILGGTILSGGKVSVVGTILGAILMSMVVNGLFLLNVSQYWFQTFLGGILLGSYEINKFRKRYLLQKQQ